MNFYHLKYFYDSARLGSITQAARLNRVGQPAISKGIQNLEASFQKNLISHERNRFRLTEEGEVVYSYCEIIFSATDELRDSLAIQRDPVGEVRFACPSSMAESDLVSNCIQSISKKYPRISLKLMLGRTDLICDWVRCGVVDFGICLDNVDLTGFESELLKKGFHYLIRGNAYSGNWKKEGVLTIEGKREVLELRRMYHSIHKERLPSKMEIGSWTVIKKFVRSGLGVGLIPDYMIQEDLKNKTVTLVEPKSLAVPYEVRVIRKPKKYLSRRCQLVLEELQQKT